MGRQVNGLSSVRQGRSCRGPPRRSYRPSVVNEKIDLVRHHVGPYEAKVEILVLDLWRLGSQVTTKVASPATVYRRTMSQTSPPGRRARATR